MLAFMDDKCNAAHMSFMHVVLCPRNPKVKFLLSRASAWTTQC